MKVERISVLDKTLGGILLALALAMAPPLLAGCDIFGTTVPDKERQGIEADLGEEAYSQKYASRTAAALEVNANSRLPMPLLSSRDGIDPDDFEQTIDNFMSFDYYTSGYMVSFAGYPTDEDGFYLTCIEFSEGEWDAFGVCIGMSRGEAVALLRAAGYEAQDAGEWEFQKDGVTIRIEGLEAIDEIEVAVPSDYTSGRLY